MALFNHLFPYTNLHDINLDWIISIIKSIDPAVIQALQNLTPDIIEQVNQKVAEAQAAAIAAQSSASEANTARDEAVKEATEAAEDSSLANAYAVRAEAAKTDVETSLVPVISTITPVADVTIDINQHIRTGKTAIVTINGQLNLAASGDLYTTIAHMPFATYQNRQFYGTAFINNQPTLCRFYGTDLAVESSKLGSSPYFSIISMSYPTN